MIILDEGRVGVDVAAEAFTDDEFGVREVKTRVEGCPWTVLEAVFGPEGLKPVSSLYCLVRSLIRVGRGVRDVARRVPVLREDNVIESSTKSVYERDDCVSICNRQGSSRAKVVLEIDDEKGVRWLQGYQHLLSKI